MCEPVGRWIVSLLLPLVLMESVAGQSVLIPPDATVGLVLSGGGARGLAHVGVLRVLEAQGIHPQVVTGTSMGSIVGALYASGRNVDEIDRIARTMNWHIALSDASPRRHQPYPFRQLDAQMSTDLRMSINSQGISFPKGAIEGQHLDQTLGKLFENNGRPLRFADMPRRFAAVAADIESGAAVIMDQGEVATAVRASMSIPGVIAPVSRHGKLLVDGGIANNMPVDVARAMGADFIIAVDVSSPLKSRHELTSFFSIANQTTAFLVRLNTVEQRANLRPDEVLILPPLDDFGSADFDQADPIIEAGLTAALQRFSMARDELPAAVQSAVETHGHLPQIDFIRVENTSVVNDEAIRSQIRQPMGEPLDRALLEEDMSRLYGLDYFSVMRYRVVEEGGESGLEVTGIGRETGNNWLKLGLELADDFQGNSVFGLTASLRAAGLNQYGGTAFGRVVLGTAPELELRFLQPITSDLAYFVEPAVGYRADSLDVYVDDYQSTPISEYEKQDLWSTLSLGRLIWNGAGEIRMGVARERGAFDFRGGYDLEREGADLSDYDDGFYFGQLGWDTLDDLGFPTSGYRWKLKAERHIPALEAGDDFSRVELDGTLPISWGRNTLLIEADGEVSDSDEASFVDIPFIGGFLELSGLPPRSRFGRHRVLMRGVFYRQLNENGPLPINVPLYLGASLERGNVWLDRDEIRWRNAIGAGSLFLGARTPLGPAYLSYGRTEEGDQSVSIFLGQRFR